MADDQKHRKKGEEFKPTGTLFVLFLFLVMIIVLWGTVYLILINRGVTP
jgi:hypothetical protein